MEDNYYDWVEEVIGPVNMQKVREVIINGLVFELEFLKDPFEFCATNPFKAYMGLGLDPNLGETYIFVYQKDVDAFAVIWIYQNGHMPALLLEKEALQRFIDGHDFKHIDNEIFLLWLGEQKDMLKKAYKKYKAENDTIIDYYQSFMR